jgi:hypothetical protein
VALGGTAGTVVDAAAGHFKRLGRAFLEAVNVANDTLPFAGALSTVATL